MSIVVVHDVSGSAALYHFEFMDVGGCVRVPDDAGILDGLVLCMLGVWFCVGMCGCFYRGRLMLCLLFVRSC